MVEGRHFPPRTSPQPQHYQLLDWLRFLSALLVVLCHVRPQHWVEWSAIASEDKGILSALFLALIRPGPEAVIVFFVLSGYLVGGRLFERWRDASFDPVAYARDRVTRIFIPLIGAAPLTVLVVFNTIGVPAEGFAWEVLGNVLQTQGVLVEPLTGNGPFWSLSYEVWFYVLGGEHWH